MRPLITPPLGDLPCDTPPFPHPGPVALAVSGLHLELPDGVAQRHLAEQAVTQKHRTPRARTERWMEAVDILRRKGWTYPRIYAFFTEQGEILPPRLNTFVSTVSRGYRAWLRRREREERS